MHCPCMSRPCLESDEIFWWCTNLEQPLLVPVRGCWWDLWGEPEEKKAQLPGRAGEQDLREGSPAVTACSREPTQGGTAHPCERSVSSVSLPQLWQLRARLSLPQAVISSNQGAAHAATGMAVLEQLSFGKPWGNLLAGPRAGAALVPMATPAKLLCNWMYLEIKPIRVWQGLF